MNGGATLLGLYGFYLELTAAQLIVMVRVRRRRFFLPRLLLMLAVGVGIYWMPMLRIGFFGVSFILIMIYSALGAAFAYKTSAINVAFCTLAAYAMQHIASDCHIIFLSFAEGAPVAVDVAMHVLIFVTVYLLLALVFVWRSPVYEVRREKLPALIVCLLILVITCVLADLENVFGGETVLYRVYSVMSCIFALGTQYGMTRSGSLNAAAEKLSREKAVLDGMLIQEKKQHELSAETIDAINMKCHDLKHRISLLRDAGGNADEIFGDIERSVMVYGDIAKTGDPALDIVLTEKHLLCEKYGISFTYVAEKGALDGVDAVDVSVLLGNALDNAIECAVKEPEDGRVIRMNISSAAGFVRISVENGCTHPPEFVNGLPKTTKKNADEHGYGMRSIVMIAEKYGGKAVASCEGGVFSLGVVLARRSEAGVSRTAADGLCADAQAG